MSYMNQPPSGGYQQSPYNPYGPPSSQAQPNAYNNYNNQPGPPVSSAPPPMGGGVPPTNKPQYGGYGEGRQQYPQGPGGPALNGPSGQGSAPMSNQYGQPKQPMGGYSSGGPRGPPPGQMQGGQGPPMGGQPPQGQASQNLPGSYGMPNRPPVSSSQPGFYQPGAPPMSGGAPPMKDVTNKMSTMSVSRGAQQPGYNMGGQVPTSTFPGSQQGPGYGGPPLNQPPPSSQGGYQASPPNPYSGAQQTNYSNAPPTGYGNAPPLSSYAGAPPPSSNYGPPTSMAGGPLPLGGGPPGVGGMPPYGSGGPPPMGSSITPPTTPPGTGAQPGYVPSGPPPGAGGMGMPPPGGAGYGQPGSMQPQPQAQPAPKRLDPDQMPSAIQVIEDDRKNRGGQQFITNLRGQVPPLITTDFQVIDQGNCSPRFMRSTMYSIPCTQDLVKQSQIPTGVVISPFAQLINNENPPPIVDHGPNGPVRCIRCKAYMCSFMQFVEGGRRFQCAFCGGLTEVPPEFFQPLDHMGKRVDMYERPELSLGTFEFLATTDYCKNNKLPPPPAYIFMIDVTYQSVKTGMVNLLCQELKTLLDQLPREHGAQESSIRVGFVTYDTTLHFYNVNSALAQPQMLVVSDINDVFMPLLDGFLVQLSESRAVIESLLDQIPEMFAETRETESMLGPVVQAGLEALKAADASGKLLIFHSSLAILEGPGKLKNRDDRKLLGTDKEKTVLSPQISFYTKLSQECVVQGCSVDMFLFPNSYVDVATIGQVCTLTGGQCYKYSYFQASNDGERFIHDLTRNLTREVGFDAVLRVRTSTGIRPTDFYGNFHMSNTTDVEMASLDADKAVTVEIKHDDKLQEDVGAFIQTAVLYTSVSGQRRLRIINLSLNCCTQMADMYRNCETDTIINFLAKHAIRSVFTSNPKAIRDGVISRCANILACYRKNCASPSSHGQLILPECMKVLPLYVNCVLKSDAFSGTTDITTDDRSWLMQTVLSMNVASTHAYFYPRLLPVHDMDVNSEELPSAVRCSVERFQDQGVYLLENGIMLFLWIGLHVNNEWVQSVFGVNSPAQINIESQQLLERDNPTSRKLRAVISAVRAERPRYMKLTLVRQRDTLEPWFRHFLMEDKGSNASASYVDFLVHMHREIRNILS
ncbi:protein transport protein Sec24C-like [Diadema antillarum]|uniref:protein transport protein Sec24C-like n=1 Tax=Diadema antillarum TaxID=105358 RepID=UPI003A8A8284